MPTEWENFALRVVVSGAPGTGKSTVAELLADRFGAPLLSLDIIKEALGDTLGAGDEAWSNRVGDAAAEVVFRLARLYPSAVVEGWWRRERRDRAIREFAGWTEVFCRCRPDLAEQRARARLTEDRHPIHRDVMNPSLLDDYASFAATVSPLHLGGPLVEVDTTDGIDADALVARVRDG